MYVYYIIIFFLVDSLLVVQLFNVFNDVFLLLLWVLIHYFVGGTRRNSDNTDKTRPAEWQLNSILLRDTTEIGWLAHHDYKHMYKHISSGACLRALIQIVYE